MFYLKNIYSQVENKIAIQRITALWAFTESGIGGALHALQIPITGIIVGSLSIFWISLIAYFSKNKYKNILQSCLLVLIIKAIISPYTPFTAYIAVGFQALFAFAIYHLFSINIFSIFLVSTITLLESALQKLMLLFLFYGNSLIEATNQSIHFLENKFHIITHLDFKIFLFIYLLFYLFTGIFLAIFTFKFIYEFNLNRKTISEENVKFQINISSTKKIVVKKNITFVCSILFILCLLFFNNYLNNGLNKAFIKLVTSTVILMTWYFFISPIISNILKKYILNYKAVYTTEVAEILFIIPILKVITKSTWQQCQTYYGVKKITRFLFLWVNKSLTFSTLKSNL